METEWTAYQADKFHYRGPNCENYPDMFERARPFVDELLEHPARHVAIISHGMIGKVMISILLGLGEKDTLALHQPNDVVVVISGKPGAFHAHHFIEGAGPIEGLHIEGDQRTA
ncbi:MAG: histidine phosphatase family protein [Gammaproteobacteria bacterium]|nr:histidine phosphatase family protein [Gammaproteobacteria bacterium]